MKSTSIRTAIGSVLALAVAASALTCSTAYAAGDMAAFATGGYATGIRTMDMMHKIDINGDGMISKDEWVAFQEKVFAMLDKKKTGVIDAKEFMTADKQEMASFATGGYARGLLTHKMMTKLDADGDGTISHDEFMNYQLKIFDMMDTSVAHKGMLSKSEWFATGGKDSH